MALIEDVLEVKMRYEKKIEEIIFEFVTDNRKEIPMLEVQRFKTRITTRLQFLQELNEIIEKYTL